MEKALLGRHCQEMKAGLLPVKSAPLCYTPWLPVPVCSSDTDTLSLLHALPSAAIPANLRNKGWSDARAFAATQLQKNPNAYFYRHVAPHEQQVVGSGAGAAQAQRCGRPLCSCWVLRVIAAYSTEGERSECSVLCLLCQNVLLLQPLPALAAPAPSVPQAQGEWTEEEHALFLATARANGVGDKWGLFASHIPQRVGYQCSAYYRRAGVAGGGLYWCGQGVACCSAAAAGALQCGCCGQSAFRRLLLTL